MITVFNAENYAQQWLFSKAFSALKAKNLLTEKELELGRFLSLDGYFAHMKDLIAIEPNYVLIPTDEKPFVINANTRTITIPADFSKCAGVVGDDMCEIITFTIDRYFDYVDLATANICIQWNTKNGEGISHVSLIDLETEPGKIRFGWPLTSAITANEGNVTFAVRFFIKDQSDKFVYLFNTLSANLPIRAGLNIEAGDNVIVEESVSDLFSKFVQNSNNPSFPVPAPVDFGAPGLNLLPLAAIDPDTDSLTLIGQGRVSDNGHIQYKWYFKEGATAADDNADLEAEVLESTDKRFEIKGEYVPIDTPEKRNGSEQYYIETTDAEGAKSYQLVTSKDLPTEVQLYERVTTLRIRPASEVNDEALSQAITGLYWIGATNYVGESYSTTYIDPVTGEESIIQALNHTPEVRSTRCYVPTPANIEVEKALVQDAFLKDNKATLDIDIKEDGGKPIRNFTWYRNNDAEEVVIDDTLKIDSGIEKDKLNVDTVGWYYVKVDSTLNRKEKTLNSSICRVLNEPIKPSLLLQYCINPLVNAEDPNAWNDDIANMADNPSIALGTDVRLQVTANVAQEDINLNLLSDELRYEWYVNVPNSSGFRLLTEEDKGENNLLIPTAELNKPYLDVQCLFDGSAYAYYCKVTNVLKDRQNNKEHTAVYDLADYTDTFIIK